MAEEELGFLSRWSRRKRALERGEAVPDAPVETPPAGIDAVGPAPLATPAEPALCDAESGVEAEFDPASLPPVETLDAASDFTAFLKPGVPQALRAAALRKAWTADPLIRDFVNSLDYGWDFNTPGGLPNGFSDTLGVTGEALRKMISQAIGTIEPEAEKPPEAVLAEADPAELPPAEALEAPEVLPMPESPIRLSEAPPIPVAPPVEEPPPPPRRRHGGALPA